MRKIIVAALAASTLSLGAAAPAVAQDPFGIEPGSFTAGAHRSDGSEETQAGAHPDSASTSFLLTLGSNGLPSGRMRDVKVKLPAGFSGNPEAVSKCARGDFADLVLDVSNNSGGCPPDSQVGIARIANYTNGVSDTTVPVYLLDPPDGVAAQIGMPVAIVPVTVSLGVDPTDDYRVEAEALRLSQGVVFRGVRVTLWGNPNDPAHDFERYCGQPSLGGLPTAPCPVNSPRKPFLTNPSLCGAPLTTALSVDTWANPGDFASALASQPAVTGCDRLRFTPSVAVEASSPTADSPSGLAVDLSLPQDDDPQSGLAPPALRDAKVTLPEGMTINPASADGLQACPDEQLSPEDETAVACPAGSKIGTVVAETPLLAERLTGSVYLRPQASQDPESGEMFRLVLVVESEKRGLRFKLPGSVRANAATGRLETTFLDNPQLPVSRVRVELKSGPRAPLALPQDCGEKAIDAELKSWAGHVVTVSDSIAVDCPSAAGFAPDFVAGSASLTGGGFSPLTAQITRYERDQYLSGVGVDLPEGLLAKLKGVELCPDAAADGGVCPAGSRVGTATVSAGAGPNPFFLKGDVFLTGPYKGAPYGLATHVHAKAGPFDLDWVRVRQALNVDPESARVSAVSDPLPQVVKGVPVRLRSVDVDVDRPGFAINPTSCAKRQVGATLTSTAGAVHKTGDRFQVAGCHNLGFKPRLAMRLSGRKQTRTGGHPGLRAVVSQGDGQSNIAGAEVTLPPSVVLDPVNTNDPKLLCGYDESLRADCPASSVIGTATANTPLLDKPLTGQVHLVQGIKFGKSGNRIRTTPSLLVKLRGQVAINLRARTTATGGRLVTTFPSVPDARVSRFAMNIKGGGKGILVVTRTRRGKINLCNGRQTAKAEIDGHNTKTADFSVAVKTPCAATKAARKAKKSKRR